MIRTRLKSPALLRSPRSRSILGTSRSACRSAGFSLIELLVVIGIIALLLVATIPAVRSLTQTGGRKGAVSTVMNALEHARALAVTSGRATYVVFADPSTPEAYRCKAFIVFQDDQSFTPQPVTKWYFLPTGMSFRPQSGILAAQTSTPAVGFKCPGFASASMPLPFVKFDSNGMVPVPTGGLWIDMFSGFVDASGTQSFTDQRQQSTGKYDAVVLSRFTGRGRYVDPFS